VADIASLDRVEVGKEVVYQRHLLRQDGLLGVCEEDSQVADCVASRIQELPVQVSHV
jgi:hypothetical protein